MSSALVLGARPTAQSDAAASSRVQPSTVTTHTGHVTSPQPRPGVVASSGRAAASGSAAPGYGLDGTATRQSTLPSAPSSTSPQSRPSTSAPTTTATAQPEHVTPAARRRAAARQLHTLVARGPAGGTSVAAFDLTSGRRVQLGARSGMVDAGAAGLQLLESLLVLRGRAGRYLSSADIADTTAMIEHSDNTATNAVFDAIGGHSAVLALQPTLGLTSGRTVLGAAGRWGLTTTSAMQQLVLLTNLVSPFSPLDAPSRRYALSLLTSVTAAQRWGVPAAATSGVSAVKNGWLALDPDGGRVVVNSLGIVTAGGHTVLVAVLTQHGTSLSSGISRVEALAKAAVAATR